MENIQIRSNEQDNFFLLIIRLLANGNGEKNKPFSIYWVIDRFFFNVCTFVHNKKNAICKFFNHSITVEK